jgi:hypothetical protein
VTAMNDLVVRKDLSALVREQPKINLPTEWVPTTALVNLAAQDQKITYLRIRELLNGWSGTYSKYIVKAIWEENEGDLAARRVEEILRSFEEAMTDLGPGISEYQAVTRKLEALRAAIRARPRPGFFYEMRQRRRREKIRDLTASIVRSIKAMEHKAATPAFLKRQWQKVWGEIKIEISKEDEDRLKRHATYGISRASWGIWSKLNIADEKTIEAFATLQLPMWATAEDVEARYKTLMQQYHPDKNQGPTEVAAKINNARDTLWIWFAAGSKDSPSDKFATSKP